MAATGTKLLGAADEARAVLDALGGGHALAVLTRLDGSSIGARMFVDDRAHGTLGDASLDAAAAAIAHTTLASPSHETKSVSLEGARILVEVHRAAPPLFIVGAGHISVPLASIACISGFRVTVLDDREEFADASRFDGDVHVVRMDATDPFADVRPDEHAYVVLVTRAHAYDYECLRDLLRRDPLPRYIGMIGSRRRVRAAFAALLEEGVPRERLTHVRAPLGLDIAAETPEEIAISIAAEMVAVRRGATDRNRAGAPLSARDGTPLSAREAVLDRFFPVTTEVSPT